MGLAILPTTDKYANRQCEHVYDNDERSLINDQNISKDKEQKGPQSTHKDNQSAVNSSSITGKAFAKGKMFIGHILMGLKLHPTKVRAIQF